MATKPLTLPVPWAPSPTYTTGTFVGQPNKAAAAGAVAVDGHRPGAAFPTPAEYVNYDSERISDWLINWVSQGSATVGSNTHIMETDANGRTAIVGIDLTDAVDRSLGTWSGSNTVVPAVILTTGGGTGLQVATAPGAPCLDADLSTSGGGIGLSVTDSPGDISQAFSINMQGGLGASNGLGSLVVQNDTPGLTISSVDADTLTLNATGGGAPLVMPPKATPAIPIAGQIWPDSVTGYLTYHDAGVTPRKLWQSEEGQILIYVENLVAAAAGGGVYLTTGLFNVVAGKRYKISYSWMVGRTVGGTREVFDFSNIGGFFAPFPSIGNIFNLFQAGGVLQNERGYATTYVWTAPFSFATSFDVILGSTAGAGTVQITLATIMVEGAYD